MKAQQVLFAKSRAATSTPVPSRVATIPEEDEGAEWALLASLCSKGAGSLDAGSRATEQYMGATGVFLSVRESATKQVHTAFSTVSMGLYDVCWSMQQLAFKVILDIGCMRSVVGVRWATEVLERWKAEGRWHRVEKENEAFRFGDGEVLHSRYRMEFIGSFAGKPVVYGFSIVEGVCPPLFSRSGCTQLGVVIDCEHHSISSRRLGIKSFGLGRAEGHYTLCIDDSGMDVAAIDLPRDFRLGAGMDAMSICSEVLPEKPENPAVNPVAVGSSDLTAEEIALLTKRRQKAALAKSKAQQHRALTEEKADYPSLSHVWSAEVGLNLAAATRSRMVTFGWKRMLWQLRVKQAIEQEGTKRWKRNPRWLAKLFGKEVAALWGHFGAMRQKINNPDKMKKAVAEGQKTMDMVVRAAADPGGYRVMEMGPAASSLPLCLASPSSWSCSETLEVDVGWGPDFQEKSKKFIAEVREQKPDLLVIRPVPWLLRAAEGDEQLWERRRLQLPLWHVVLELWKLQDEAGRLVVLSQPVASEALFLTFLKERREVLRVVVARCAFAEDGQALRPQPEELYLEVNEGKFATALQVSGDTFFVWDQAGTKFAVTHFIDGLTDYHLGDLTDRPDSSFSREVLQDLWYATFGPPDLLLTDGGTEFAGHVEILNQLFGVVREIIPEGAKWRMGQAERHGAIVKLMIMRMAKALSLKGLDGMRQAALAAFSAKNRLMNKGG
ncbi:unnamed protein product, partial [Symbiodinium microadriaticum]